MNGVKGAQKGAYESSGGGTGHPFGTSGRGSVDGDNDEGNGGYGAGSGGKQNTSGGCGVYTNISSTIPNTIKNGSIIGNQFVVPIAGGSGGASANPNPLLLERGFGGYGGGGGGAIVINARNVTLHKITANGSIGQNNSYGAANVRGGNGSAGAVVVSARVKLLVDSVLCFPYGSSMDGVSRYDV